MENTKPTLVPMAIGILLLGGVVGYFLGNNDLVAITTSTPIASVTPTAIISETPRPPVADSYRGTKISKTTTYRNIALGFQITFPAGWYIPDSSDPDPHAYESGPKYDCGRAFGCENALEILSYSLTPETYDESFQKLTTEDRHPSEFLDLVPGARVIRSDAPGAAEGWTYHYGIFYYNELRFGIFTNNEILEKTVLYSFRILCDRNTPCPLAP